ncbi:MAG: hypothetical protein WD872_08475, partial [Pirellulaceae bacterium]
MRLTHMLGCGLLGLVLSASGCKTFTAPDWSKNWFGDDQPKIEESKYPRPVRLAVIWSPAVLNVAGKPPTRGFGGRMYFYDAANDAIPVEGQLVVYAYDDSQPHATGKTPDRKYAYTPEQFTEHFSPTELGASYSVWLPWDEAGQAEADISLVPVFTASSGQLVVGQPSKNLLPGPSTPSGGQTQQFSLPAAGPLPPDPANGPPNLGVQQASFEQHVGLGGESQPHHASQPQVSLADSMRELSISVPESLAERMARSSPQTRMRQ